MKILHTSDWHVGKVLKGQSRLDEHIAVLDEIVDIAEAERPDLVIVAGDLYDTAAPDRRGHEDRHPGADARCAGTGAEVVAIAGNHDNGAGARRAARLGRRGRASPCAARSATGPTDHAHHRRHRRRRGVAAGRAAVPVPAVRGPRASEMFELTAAEAQPDLRRPHRPGCSRR